MTKPTMNTKTTVIHHSSDYDGIFCREIAKMFLPDAELIGWDFADSPIPVPDGGIYILDLPVDRVFGFTYETGKGGHPQISFQKGADPRFFSSAMPLAFLSRVIWVDHHASSIKSHPTTIPGYRIDGVAACRLAWQWFDDRASCQDPAMLPSKHEYVERRVKEPLAVRLAGEYDIWDKRDPDAELFQHGLRSEPLDEYWPTLLSNVEGVYRGYNVVTRLLERGKCVQYVKNHENESIITSAGFTIKFEGLTFLACNHARYNSHLFTAGLLPEHDACLGFSWRRDKWSVSLYHAPGKEHHDLSLIAVKHGGGGHHGACGFTCATLPFSL